MKNEFNEVYPKIKVHVIGMTQYFTHNFNEPTSPDYISTYDISSCVVVLLKNLDEKKQCSAFGMAHINFANIYFKECGIKNMLNFISDFEENGGNIETASIQLLGGLIEDDNHVRDKVADILNEIANSKKIKSLNIKIPKGFQLDISIASRDKGDGQKMAMTCDKKGTYIRKVTFKEGKIAKYEFSPEDCDYLANTNYKYYVPVERDEHMRLMKKTNAFQVEINNLLKNKDSQFVKQGIFSKNEFEIIKNIQNNYCTLDKTIYIPIEELSPIKQGSNFI